MKQKVSKFKRILIASMAVVCAVSTAAVITVSSASDLYTYTVDCAASSTTYQVVPTTKTGEVTDTYGNFPTIYDGKTTSTVQSYVTYNNNKNVSLRKTVTLQKDSASHPAVNYGTLSAGSNRHYFTVTSGGGFKVSVTSRNRY